MVLCGPQPLGASRHIKPCLPELDDVRHDPPNIDPHDIMRQRAKRLNPAHLHTAQQNRNAHRQRLLEATVESTNQVSCKILVGPEPKFETTFLS